MKNGIPIPDNKQGYLLVGIFIARFKTFNHKYSFEKNEETRGTI